MLTNEYIGTPMKQKLTRVLFTSLLATFFVSSVLTIVAMQLIQSANVKSLEGSQADFIESLAMVIWILFLTVASLPVFLNLIKFWRDNFLLNLLSFYLVPSTVAIVVYFSNQSKTGWISFLVSTLSFMVVLTFFYLKLFRINKSFPK